MRFRAATPGASTFIDLIAPAVREITLNGQRVDPAEAFKDSRIALSNLQEDNELRVLADCAYMNTGEGLHRMIDPVDGEAYLYTQFEVPDSRRVFAAFEQPDLKATFAFTVQAPESWQLFSTSPTPAPQSRSDGTAVWAFEPTPRISSYITALVGGKYHVARDSEHTTGRGQKIPLAVAIRASLAEYLDAGGDLRDHPAGLRLLPREVRLRVPVREVRPALRAGIQRGRDGERRLRHLPRGV